MRVFISIRGFFFQGVYPVALTEAKRGPEKRLEGTSPYTISWPKNQDGERRARLQESEELGRRGGGSSPHGLCLHELLPSHMNSLHPQSTPFLSTGPLLSLPAALSLEN